MDIGQVIRREDDNVAKKALTLEVYEQRKRGRPRQTWRRQIEDRDVEAVCLQTASASTFIASASKKIHQNFASKIRPVRR